MHDESRGRWAIIETVGDYRTHTGIRCFFENAEAAQERFDSYQDFERANREVRFVYYGEPMPF